MILIAPLIMYFHLEVVPLHGTQKTRGDITTKELAKAKFESLRSKFGVIKS